MAKGLVDASNSDGENAESSSAPAWPTGQATHKTNDSPPRKCWAGHGEQPVTDIRPSVRAGPKSRGSVQETLSVSFSQRDEREDEGHHGVRCVQLSSD